MEISYKLKPLFIIWMTNVFRQVNKVEIQATKPRTRSDFFSYGIDLHMGRCFGVFSPKSFLLLRDLNTPWSGRQEMGAVLSVSKHLYPQNVEKCHLCPHNTTLLCFNVKHCLHEPDSPLKYLFSSSQADIKEFLHQWSLPSCLKYAVCSPCIPMHAPLFNQPQPWDQ